MFGRNSWKPSDPAAHAYAVEPSDDELSDDDMPALIDVDEDDEPSEDRGRSIEDGVEDDDRIPSKNVNFAAERAMFDKYRGPFGVKMGDLNDGYRVLPIQLANRCSVWW